MLGLAYVLANCLAIKLIQGQETVRWIKIESPCGKTNNVVSEQFRHRPVCAVTEAG